MGRTTAPSRSVMNCSLRLQAMTTHDAASVAEHLRLDELSRSRIRHLASGGLRLQASGVALLIAGSVMLTSPEVV